MAPGPKHVRVRDVYTTGQVHAEVVPAATPLRDVIAMLAKRPEMRGVFVVDGRQRFRGVIGRHDLLAWVSGKLPGEASTSAIPWTELYRMAQATTAGDAVHPRSPKAHVREDDRLDKAVRLMIEEDLLQVPVLDEEGRILGDLRLTQVLDHVLDPA